jgi:hypothetical protein
MENDCGPARAGGTLRLENLHVDGEVFLGVGADHGHELIAVGEELVEIPVDGFVRCELAERALAFVDVGQKLVELCDRVIDP